MGRKKNTAIPTVPAVAAVAPEGVLDDPSAVATAGDRTAADASADEDAYEWLQVDLGDMVKVKQILDECVAAVVLEYLPENTKWDNRKLGIMLAACCFAAVAQLNTSTSWPHHRLLLAVCGVMYFLLSTLLQFITTFIDQDTIVWTDALTEQNTAVRHKSHALWGPSSSYYSLYRMKHQGGSESPPASSLLKNPTFRQHGLRVRTSLPRFSEFYTVTLQFHVPPPSKKEAKEALLQVSQTWSIGQFFDATGYFDEMGLAREIEALLLRRLDQQQYDDTTDAVKKTV